ncbi:Uncharacterised protein [Mycobacterium tuberculosis]|uniref:Uncharacterized protein n=1 Tax=Mycobacterium tuberculosis TaxID=1773 RepID=A0A916P829_MYCTX|nr:Uncharacterised protein [Mycobacterium tuberculosis]COY19723.1 Uncharacterised protein [Mycobacterium tuberculosis]COY60984.1 Uncharacterised protein [Mycobacterium tuberculosis]COY71867.1 Uncharacterised protein [Mycobacterium tuberculosis]
MRSKYLVCTNVMPATALRSEMKLSGYREKSANPSYSSV